MSQTDPASLNGPLWARPDDPAASIGLDVIRLTKLLARLKAQRSQVLPGLDATAPTILFTLAHGPLRVSALAERTLADISTASRQIATLEQHGLVAREADPDDRRASLIHITEAGHAFARDLRERRNAIVRAIVADWPDDDVQQLADLFHRFLADAVEHAEQLLTTPPTTGGTL